MGCQHDAVALVRGPLRWRSVADYVFAYHGLCQAPRIRAIEIAIGMSLEQGLVPALRITWCAGRDDVSANADLICHGAVAQPAPLPLGRHIGPLHIGLAQSRDGNVFELCWVQSRNVIRRRTTREQQTSEHDAHHTPIGQVTKISVLRSGAQHIKRRR